MNRRTKLAPGIYQDAYGISVIASVGTHPHKLTSPERRFPLGTALPTLTAAWHREKLQLLERLQQRGGRVVRGTLARDVVEYFKTARLSPQRRQERAHQLQWWCVDRGFGSRDRATLTPLELQQAINTLQDAAASTRNHYRTALSNLFTVLDGKNGRNPFRDVPKDKEPEAARLDQPYELIQAILAHLRDRGTHGPSRAKAWIRVLAWAPVTPAQLKLVRRDDVQWTDDPPTLSTPGRKKGGGTRAQRKRIAPQAIEAFRAFDAAGCWDAEGRVCQPYPSRSARLKAFKLARDKAIAELRQTCPHLDLSRAAGMLVKDLRHSFLTVTLQETGDLAATQLMADHLDPHTTLRYAQGAVTGVLDKAGAAVAAAFAKIPPYQAPKPPAPEAGRLSARDQRSTSILSAKVFHPTFPSLPREASGENGNSRTKPADRAKPSNRDRKASSDPKSAI